MPSDQGCAESSWTEGRNLAMEWRWAKGSLDQFATLVAEMIHLQLDVHRESPI